MDDNKSELYLVQLPTFEGPLDLLLHLIEREKLDISGISIAQIADQFLEQVRALEAVGAETLAGFVQMAARLVWIKARLLLPPPPGQNGEEEEDPAEALARQLREYKRYKAVAAALRSIEETGEHAYVRIAEPPELERRLAEGGMSIDELLRAACAAFSIKEPQLPAGSVVTPFTLTIHDQIVRIREAISDGQTIIFRCLLSEAPGRHEVIVTLLAVLECVKRRIVDVRQEEMFGEIVIEPAAPSASASLPPPEDGHSNDSSNGVDG